MLLIPLILIGDGIRKSACESLVKELNLMDRVQFLGIRTDVYGIVKMADIAVLSSHWEGFGLAAVEAMACGIPLLASNVPGLAQVVEGAGILFEKGNEVELGEKILNIIQDRETLKDLIEKGIKRAQEYDINLMVEKNIKLYTRIIK